MRGQLGLYLVVCLCFVATVPRRSSAAERGVDFSREIRPILSSQCFVCHGPDEGTRQADLRLDVAQEAFADRGGYSAIVPGDAEASELYQRARSDDPDYRMPPPDSNKNLSPAQIELIGRWIQQGARYEQHWSFVPPERPPLPEVSDPRWPRNAIDYFVLARLEQEGMKPSPEADRYTLIRRVYLDLVGLLPTPDEADRFVHDRRPDAYERLVDRLLASPHYGERWARRWLDLARYADTNGYEKDRPRSIWPYRDWVIAALNDDMPFDQFSVEQIAGDMLPGATLSQRIATGFHRNTMLNEEGGIDPLEFRFHAMTDRVATTGSVWLGLTLGCAQCHTHKFDPITQREYYGFMALLNNADEVNLTLPDQKVARRRAELEEQIDRLEGQLADQLPVPDDPADRRSMDIRRREHLERRFRAWWSELHEQAANWTPLEPSAVQSNLPQLVILPDHSVLARGDQTKRDTYEVRYRFEGEAITAIRLDVLADPRLPAGGPGRAYYEGPAGDFFLSELTVLAGGQSVAMNGASHSYAKLAVGSGESAAALALDGEPHTGWSTSGREGESHWAVFYCEQPIRGPSELEIRLLFDRHYSAGLGRFRISVTGDSRRPLAFDMPADLERLLKGPLDDLSPRQRDQLLRQFLRSAPELATQREAIQKLRQQLPKYPTTLICEERPADNPRPTYLHHRGEFLQPRDPVPPDVPAVLHPLPPTQPANRLTLAHWLVSRDNPLVARVTVNRQWSAMFGQGIVATEGDFGYQGQPPSHPQLLDWLATELIRQGWSLKQIHRLIVTSSTYRQSSRVTDELLAKDPQNHWLGRGARVRLEAELIRDSVLCAAGVLTTRIGGPSVFPPQPASVTTEGAYGALNWQVSAGADRYRRGLYTFSKRTAPYAMFTTFDAPSGESCVVKRDVSNSPLQALTVLNDQVFIEAAQVLGRTIAGEPGTDRQRIERLFRCCLTRPPTPAELDLMHAFFTRQLERFRSGVVDPASIAGDAAGTAVSERAAWTLLGRAILNLDEMITKR